MNKLSVGFDVDDVLLPSAEHAIVCYNERFGTALTARDWYKNQPLDRWKADTEHDIVERVNDILNSDDYLTQLRPMDGATRVLDEIEVARDHKFAVTSRPVALAAMTHKALDRCYPGVFPVGTVHFINFSTAVGAVNKISKVQVALSQKATHIVDDFEHHLVPMVEASITPYLFGDDYDWNRNASTPGIERVASMAHLRERLIYERNK